MNELCSQLMMLATWSLHIVVTNEFSYHYVLMLLMHFEILKLESRLQSLFLNWDLPKYMIYNVPIWSSIKSWIIWFSSTFKNQISLFKCWWDEHTIIYTIFFIMPHVCKFVMSLWSWMHCWFVIEYWFLGLESIVLCLRCHLNA